MAYNGTIAVAMFVATDGFRIWIDSAASEKRSQVLGVRSQDNDAVGVGSPEPFAIP